MLEIAIRLIEMHRPLPTTNSVCNECSCLEVLTMFMLPVILTSLEVHEDSKAQLGALRAFLKLMWWAVDFSLLIVDF